MHITTLQSCLVEKRTNRLGKSSYNIPIYIKFSIPHYYSSKEERPVHTWSQIQNGHRLKKYQWATQVWSYPLMRIDNIFSKLHVATLFSTLDVRSGYYNIIGAKTAENTPFTTEYSKYEFLHIPFGIHIVPSYFAMIINGTLKGLDFCFAYLDDFIIYSKWEREHLDHLWLVYDCLCVTYQISNIISYSYTSWKMPGINGIVWNYHLWVICVFVHVLSQSHICTNHTVYQTWNQYNDSKEYSFLFWWLSWTWSVPVFCWMESAYCVACVWAMNALVCQIWQSYWSQHVNLLIL